MTIITVYLIAYVARRMLFNPEDWLLFGLVILFEWAGWIEVKWPPYITGRWRDDADTSSHV